MKAPLSWLKDFLPLTAAPHEIADVLTSLGIEVEKISGMEVSFIGVVVGRVLEASQHPNADRLHVARVTDGKEEYRVVCGAPNCRAGITVAFAKIGAELTSSDGKKWKIKKSKIRDIESEGMICSASELQLGQDGDGIIELPSDTPLGVDFASLVTDPVFEVALTPNLGHCLSMLGLARELAAAYKTDARPPDIHLKETGKHKLKVEISDPKLCPRYACRQITNIRVGSSSPEWMQKRLLVSGLRPVNNIVDIGNYVMLEFGQPLHIFDADHIAGQKIIVSPAADPFIFETLDHQKREIPPQTLLIRDAEKPLAIAGIMGGLSSAISPATRTILIESALFDPASIRKSSRLLDLKSDAAYRFERGIDAAAVLKALDRAAQLIHEIAGGEIHPVVDISTQSFQPRTVLCRPSRISHLIGLHLSLNEIIELFERLEMQTHMTSEDLLEVKVPTYRNDLHHEIDLVEEIARLYGYSNIPRKKPIYSTGTLPDAPIYLVEKETRRLCLQEGLQECITCDLISPTLSRLTHEKNLSAIHVLHPRSLDQSVLRTSLLPGLLQVARHNGNHQIKDISAFEIGKVHFRTGVDIQEASCLGIILTGKARPHHFDRKPSDVDFFDLKGMMENICDQLRLLRLHFEPSHLHTLHPWRQAVVKSGDVTLGVVGEIHPHLLQQFDLSMPVYFSELNLSDIVPLKKKARLFADLPLFPASELDWTLALKEGTPITTVFQAIERTRSPYLDSFYLLDLYTGPNVEKGKKNATFRFIYRDAAQTLSFETVEGEHRKLIQSVAEKLHDCL